MSEIDRLCAICAEEGVGAVLQFLPNIALGELAQACRLGAEEAAREDQFERAERLQRAAEYLAYLELPYESD
jgi:hypothetical protein